MSKELYTKEYLFQTLHELKWVLDDLGNWTGYNQDILSDEVVAMQRLAETLTKTFIALDKEGKLPEEKKSTCLTCFGLDNDMSDCENCNSTGYEK